ncbi:unnamed protein product, partial [Closterium sp. NIES-54]
SSSPSLLAPSIPPLPLLCLNPHCTCLPASAPFPTMPPPPSPHLPLTTSSILCPIPHHASHLFLPPLPLASPSPPLPLLPPIPHHSFFP